jgi:predicted peroxiredoxin
MAEYLFLQSQEPFTDARAAYQYQLAIDLAEAGERVRMLLIQNGVVPARKSTASEAFEKIANSAVQILADDFSLKQRQIDVDQLHAKVTAADISTAITALADGHKVIWN